jgi:hypothetical protein
LWLSSVLPPGARLWWFSGPPSCPQPGPGVSPTTLGATPSLWTMTSSQPRVHSRNRVAWRERSRNRRLAFSAEAVMIGAGWVRPARNRGATASNCRTATRAEKSQRRRHTIPVNSRQSHRATARPYQLSSPHPSPCPDQRRYLQPGGESARQRRKSADPRAPSTRPGRARFIARRTRPATPGSDRRTPLTAPEPQRSCTAGCPSDRVDRTLEKAEVPAP